VCQTTKIISTDAPSRGLCAEPLTKLSRWIDGTDNTQRWSGLVCFFSKKMEWFSSWHQLRKLINCTGMSFVLRDVASGGARRALAPPTAADSMELLMFFF